MEDHVLVKVNVSIVMNRKVCVRVCMYVHV